MDILLVVRWPVGGIRTYLKYMLSDPAMQGKRFTLLTLDLPGVHQMIASFPDAQVTLITVPPSTRAFIRAVLKALCSGKYQLIHAHGMTAAVAATIGGLVRPSVPLIVSSHDVFQAYHFGGWKGWLKYQFTKLLLTRVRIFNVLGQDAHDNLRAYFPNFAEHKIVTIRNGVDTPSFAQAQPLPLREELGLRQDDFMIGFLGRFMGQKGFRYLFEAIAQLAKQPGNRRAVVISVGAGEGFESHERNAISAAGLDEYFRFIPFSDNIGGVLKGLDLLVMPSVWECCPLMPMEALAAGTPVLGSDCIGLKEILTDTPALIFPSQDAKQLQQQLCNAMSTPDLKAPFSTFAPTAVERFNKDRAARALAALYNRFE